MDHDPTVQQEYVGHDLALQLGALEHAPSTGTCYRFPATPRVRRKPQTLQATDSAKAQNHTPGKPQSPLSPLPLQGPWFPVIQRAQTPRHPRSGSIPQIIGHDPTPQLGYLGHDLAPQMGAFGHAPDSCPLRSSLRRSTPDCGRTPGTQQFETFPACPMFCVMPP